MTSPVRAHDLILCLTPFAEPDAGLAAAATGAGALGVLDLGTGDRICRQELSRLRRTAPGRYGVRVTARCALTPADLSDGPDLVVLAADLTAADTPWSIAELAAERRVLAEVTDLPQARAAVRAGAQGLIARGAESGGRTGALSTFVLLQQLVADAELADSPVWACGGVGPRTAAAAMAGGAAGVVLDSQLALLPESRLPEAVRAVLRSLDGAETVVLGGHRVLRRRGPDAPQLPADDPTAIAALLGARDPAHQLLPVGQDGFLAARFAERWGDVRGVVRGMTAAMRPQSEPESGPEPECGQALRPGSAMSRALGTRLPVAQGPMTRVSDQAGFAAAVAEEGALPFLALALADGARTRAMLTEARAVLDGRPWGVGVLGFAPEEIRNAQLEVVRQLRPTHAIIAGGRPAQAEALERAGIRTFLHVPSPGLLRQFLQAGARRFVFEGSECGGHVGPRASFPLWEAQLAVLDDFLADAEPGTAAQVEVLFAGGVHDERSAAMVAALAAPLTKMGAAIGVLMGTAYLFTEEAVAHGAIRPLFQEQVRAATATALLETAPGHATRCVPSPFTDDYRDRERALRAGGLPDREVWQTLERLNVGRLRIASKGVERADDGELRDVDEQRQLADGMFMAGEVAVLRSATTTMAALHRSVTDGAADFLAARGPLPVTEWEPAPPAPLDIAIVGMACMFPGAPDLAAFWANIVAGRDAVTEVPADRWDPDVHHAAGHTASKWGGFLPRIPFDPLRYGIPPTSLGSIEPVQLLSLEAARRALEDAGYGERGREFDRSRTAVVFGAEAGSDLSNAVTLRAVLPSYYGKVPDGLDGQLPQLTEDSFPGMLANVISGRIANRLDLGGANFTVDAACASSLAALDVACKELVSGTSDVVLCGGADLHNGINDYVLFSSVHALSPTGRSRAFDAAADGIALGEGVACVVLKRLADAERAGDRIYGVVKGLGSASDGRSLGLTAPRPEGQRAALERAYRNAGVSPAQVSLVEAHGTGTVVGDRTELTILGEVFAEAGARTGGCALGSVKSQIGHTKCAAGLAGLIKTTLALYTGVTPPTLHVGRPNPAWTEDDSPFSFHTDARPWAEPAAERFAGVSAFGFGGTNFHAVLAAHGDAVPPRQTLDEWPAELFLFRARDEQAAHRQAAELLEAAEADGRPWRLRDLALAAAHRADTSREPVQVAFVARDVDQLTERLRAVLDGDGHGDGDADVRRADPVAGKVAFLFPGQGSQRTGMLAELLVALPELRDHLRPEQADVVYPPAAFDDTARERRRTALTDTRAAQPALGATGLAAHAFLGAAGVQPDLAAGHSYGELVALAAAGALDPDALPRLSGERAAAILAAAGAEPGSMAAVGAPAEDVVGALRDAGAPESVVVANLNSPQQTVISGPTPDIDTAVRLLRAAGLGAKRIPVACAFHSPVVAGAGARFAEALAKAPVRAPEFPVWANRTAAPYPGDPEGVRAELAAQIGAPVAFAAQIEAMYEAGARIFVEAGPGTVLTRLVGQILGDRPHRTVAPEPRPEGGLPGWLDALARLAVAGVPVRAARLFQGRDAVDALRAPTPARPGWTVDGQLVRTADGALLAGALAPARRVVETTVTTDQPNGAPVDRDALITEFLRSGREMIAAQRDVLLTYFGGTGSPVAPVAPVAAVAPVAPQASPSAEPAFMETESAAPVVQEEAPAASGADVARVVLEIISERTGYPVDMIEPDLDLEADLSIDSIKRAEIAGELAKRLGIAGGAELLDDAELEELTKARTAAAVTAWLAARVGGGTGPGRPEEQAPEPDAAPLGVAPRRFELRAVELPDVGPKAASVLAGQRFFLLGDGGGAAAEVAARLDARGAEVVLADQGHVLGAVDGTVDAVVYLGALPGPELPVLPDAFPVLKAALACGTGRLLAVRAEAGAGAVRAAGLDGLFRTAGREYPEVVARVVAVGDIAPAAVAEAVLTELCAPAGASEGADASAPLPVVLRAADGTRRGLDLRPVPLGSLGNTGAGPAGVGTAEAAALGLDRDSVVLLVGGARGITARFAATLAAACGCRIELLGRTPAPTAPESPATAAARTPVELRAALAAAPGVPKPAEINRTAELLLAQREITATLDELAALGSAARYRAVDFRDRDAVLRAVKEIHAEHGRLDGVVFAAGVIEDRLIAEKSPDSFQRVYGTKTAGAGALFAALDDLPGAPAFTVLFGSIAAVLGNRGQCDYAAANDALETLGADWAARTGHRALTVHWGPWAPSGTHHGMVGAELGREYARRGVAMIDPEEGTAALLRELAWGDPAARAVVYTASGW
ncbi:SDR family NAD(P)-dependent oxidoreductase [Streptomyces sp. LaBMicrA B280]|uniref:SDR family NAD(P)-dependent oxidoreductase n=1 Tax=Streptomyces sp. LaBMicrA B280 TaxID=3391001 RepID=UPI003BA79AFB